MRAPSFVGLPGKFTDWRKGQERVLGRLLYDDERFQTLVIPVGGGKSPIYMGYVGANQGRALVLTPTLVLMDQLMTDFEAMGLIDMRGRNNYTCDIDPRKTAQLAVCTAGVYCERSKGKGGPCEYYDQMRASRDSRLVVSNYRWWLHAEESGAIGRFSTVILDEAHRAPNEIADFAAVEVYERELEEFRVEKPPTKMKGLMQWAVMVVDQLEDRKRETNALGKARRLRNLMRKLARLCRLSEHDWVRTQPTEGKGWRWDLIDPGALAETMLFRGADRVILSSATIRRKTLQMLNVDPKQSKIIEQESTFPVRRRPLYYYPVAGIGQKMTMLQTKRVLECIDEFMAARSDRNGVVHCHSYNWGEEIYRNSRLRERGTLLLHERGVPGARVVEQYRARGRQGPTILISPAVTEGLDLQYKQCEFQVLAKVPFPDLGSPIVRARTQRDPTYGFYVALQTLQQAVGRGMRAPDDQCETLLPDANFGWVYGRYHDFCANWFQTGIKKLDPKGKLPEPLPALHVGS